MLSKSFPAWPANAGHALFLPLCLSVLLHAGMLAGITPISSESGSTMTQRSPRLNAVLTQSTSAQTAAITPVEGAAGKESVSIQHDRDAPESPRPTSGSTPGNDRKQDEGPEALKLPEPAPGLANILDTGPPHYFSHNELDIPPYPLEELAADSPEIRDRKESGRLVLELWIDNEGVVTRIDIVSSDLPSIFAEATRTVLFSTPFVPAKRQGSSVHARIRIELNFAPPPEMVPTKKLGRVR